MEFNTKVNHTPRDYYNNGLSFMKAAWRCYGKEKDGQYRIIDSGEICQLPAPAVVNAAFACEMFLKSLLVYYGIQDRKGHSLITLFDRLPEDSKNVISLFCGDKRDATVFRKTLSIHANDFIDIRYFVESEGWRGMDPTYMITLAFNMSEITKALLNGKEGRICQ